MCCLQELRWRGCGVRIIGVHGSRYRFRWSGNIEGYGGVDVLVKEELYGNVVEIRRANDTVMSLAIVVRVVCAYAPQTEISMEEK